MQKKASKAEISGVSSIQRDGDVRIVEKNAVQDIISNIEVGPIILRAERKVTYKKL